MCHITLSAFDIGRFKLEMNIAPHGLGPASSWAARVPVGDAVEIDVLRGSIIIAPDHAWHLLDVGAGKGALPAI